MDPITASLSAMFASSATAGGVAAGLSGAAATATGAAATAGTMAGAAATGGTLLSSLATPMMIGGAALNGLGAIQQGQAASAAAGYNAKIAEQNAEVATRNAKYAAAQGEQNIASAGAEARAKIGATLVNQGASGIDINSGSAVDTRESEAKLGMLNALNIRSSAVRHAYGFETQAVDALASANLAKMEKSSTKTSGYINAGSTILGGLGTAAKYSNFLSRNDPLGMTI